MWHGFKKDDCRTASLDRFFALEQRGSSLRTEALAGLVCFLANAYQLTVVPEIMHNGGRGLSKPAYAFAFAVTTAFSSVLVGLMSNLPVPLGIGIGCTTYVAYTLADDVPSHIPDTPTGRQAYISTVSLVASLMLLVLACLTLSWRLFRLMPSSIKGAMPVGLGLLLALDGCQMIGLVVPSTKTGVTSGSLLRGPTIIGGLACVCIAVMQHMRCRTAVVAPMVVATAVGWILHYIGVESINAPLPNFDGYSAAWRSYARMTVDLEVLEGIDGGSLALSILSLGIIVLIDVGGCTFALANAADLVENKGTKNEHLPGAHAVFFACAIGSVVSAVMGCGPVIVLAESFAGVVAGGRTGLTAIFMGLYFLLAIPLVPLFEAVPVFASAPVLFMLGVHLLSLTKYLNLDDPIEALPSFCTIALMPFFYSISNAVLAGLFMHALLRLCLKTVTLVRRARPLAC